MWKCPNCETINENEFCAVCGEKKTEVIPQQPQQAQQQQAPYPVPFYYGEDEGKGVYVAPVKKKNNALVMTVVICITLVLLMAGILVYVLMQSQNEHSEDLDSKGEQEVVVSVEPSDDEKTSSEEKAKASSEPSEPEPEPSEPAQKTPTPTPVSTPTPNPTSTPTPKPQSDAISKQTEFLTTAKEIETYVETAFDDDYTQAEMNAESATIYQKWDDLLNDVYQYLKKTMPANEFEKLKTSEIAWVKEKEAAVERELASWGGGTIGPMEANGVASEYTRERCYKLIDMIY